MHYDLIAYINVVTRYTPFTLRPTTLPVLRYTRPVFRYSPGSYDPSKYDPGKYDPGKYDPSKYNPRVDNSGRYIPDNSGAYK